MKTISAFLFFLLISTFSFSKGNDSLISTIHGNEIHFDTKCEKYWIQSVDGKVHFKKLNYAKFVGQDLQILDQKNHLIYLNKELEIVEKVRSQFGFCGTVPHYSLVIKKSLHWFYIQSDETFYDHGNKIAPEIIDSISTSLADSVFFINERTTFDYTANFGLLKPSPNPNTLIIKKGNKYRIANSENDIWYDSINYISGVLIGTTDGLKTFININPTPIYKSLGSFEHNLARFELPSGKGGYIDQKGNQYLD